MKIIHCMFQMETGGSQVLLVDLLNEMCLKHDVGLIIINNKYDKNLLKQLHTNVKVFYINRKERSRNPLLLLKLNFLIWKLKPNAIHCHEPNTAKIIKVRKSKLIYTIHDVGLKIDTLPLYKKSVAISDAVYKDVSNRYNDSICKIYNGINTQMFKARNTYALSKGEPIRILQISRLVHEKKGQDILIQALSHLPEESHDFVMDFAGEGPSIDYLQELTKKLNLKQKVNFIGNKTREWLFDNICNYHLLAQPSRFEGFGLTILEGFAAGLPVLASDIEGPAEIISQTERGFLFQNGNIKSCSEKLLQIFNLYSSNKMITLMSTSIPLTNEKYSIQYCASSYLNEYYKL